MANINFIQLSFSMLSSSMIILGSLMNTFEAYLPTFIRKTFRYGKFSCQEKSFVRKFEVPKSSFKQFYQLAVIFCTPCFILVTLVYVCEFDVPEWIILFLDLICGQSRFASAFPIHIFVAVILLTLQCYRRCYDTHYISVFSKNGYINIIHYVVGMIYYPACYIAILCEAPKFTIFSRRTTLQLSDLSNIDILATFLFIWAWWHQHITTVILANLRKDNKGVIVTDEHKLPEGDWFEYLSSPHQIAEILMYFALTVILRYNITWIFVFAWVLTNQVETIILSHQWYKKNFDKFPKKRKALIPFVY